MINTSLYYDARSKKHWTETPVDHTSFTNRVLSLQWHLSMEPSNQNDGQQKISAKQQAYLLSSHLQPCQCRRSNIWNLTLSKINVQLILGSAQKCQHQGLNWHIWCPHISNLLYCPLRYEQIQMSMCSVIYICNLLQKHTHMHTSQTINLIHVYLQIR